MVWEVNNINRYLTEQPPIICCKMLQLHGYGPHRPIPPCIWFAKAFARFSWLTRCSDSSAVFAERRKRDKQRLEAYKMKVYGQSHTPSRHVFFDSTNSLNLCARARRSAARTYSVMPYTADRDRGVLRPFSAVCECTRRAKFRKQGANK